MAWPERIRDPVHNLIEFHKDGFEEHCWRVVQTAPFQRLRRIKQLGFSELVYPGATHSRLAHSLGVFHTARHLTRVVREYQGEAKFDRVQANAAVAAALIHDIGHGPFSHAFEHALDQVGISGTHEDWTVRIVRETDVRDELNAYRPGFAEAVAKIINSESPTDVYCSIVSSQFDADRLDYMRRDRFMTGTQQGAIDFEWLLANLQIGRVKVGQDGEFLKDAETFVLGPKARMAAEAYVLGLFQLYPTVYLHKTTRGAEGIFTALLTAVFRKVIDGDIALTGLPADHALVRFAQKPDDLERYLALDDSVITGSLRLFQSSKVPAIASLASRLLNRDLFKCVDVTHQIAIWARKKFPDNAKRNLEMIAAEEKIRAIVAERNLLGFKDAEPHLFEDIAERNPYKIVTRDDGALNRMWIIGGDGEMHDLGQSSPVVRSLAPFHAYRFYFGCESGRKTIEAVLQETLQ